MALQALAWLWNRFRPREGWLSFVLLALALACLVAAVNAVLWVPEADVIIPAAIWGLLLGSLLAQRPLRPLPAWTLITLYGIVLILIWLGQLSPPLSLWSSDWWAFSQHIRQNSALLFDQIASWFVAVFSGGSSRETIVFALGLGLGAWLLAAFAAWSAFRLRRPLWGLTAIGMAMALNSYFGAAPLQWMIFFVGLAVMETAVIHFRDLEHRWTSAQIDYSDQIHWELITYASGIALFITSLTMVLPGFNINKLAQAFQQQPIIQQAEETLERIFPGIAPRRRPGQPGGPDGVGGSGVLPRSYLLGNPPELAETVVMTAVVTLPDNMPLSLLTNHHWRALSYDVYTGRGWALSEERREAAAANDLIPLLPMQSGVEIQQSINWVLDERIIRYTMGQPLRFDQDVTVIWRGLNDLVRVQGSGGMYQATSRLSAAGADELRATAVANIPAVIQNRYTNLPRTLPQRVHDLAQEAAGDLPTAYDQARALERFLRQYPYSLDVELPPDDVDPVDFFLFDLQRGYCDYYAAAMAVMARSLGLPARVAAGFLPQPPDENGVQTIYQLNGHSWTEIYFPNYGWIEFEPTAAFPSSHDSLESISPINSDTVFEPSTPEIPPAAPSESVLRRLWRGWNRILLVIVLAAGFWLWQRRQKQQAGRDTVLWAYGRLQHQAARLGQSPRASQTPDEFVAALLNHLNRYANSNILAPLADQLRPPIERLNQLFIQRQYGGKTKTGMAAAQKLWQQMRRPLLLLRFFRTIFRR